MVLDLSNPAVFFLLLIVAIAAALGFFFYAREILVSAMLEVKRREREREDREKLERGRRL